MAALSRDDFFGTGYGPGLRPHGELVVASALRGGEYDAVSHRLPRLAEDLDPALCWMLWRALDRSGVEVDALPSNLRDLLVEGLKRIAPVVLDDWAPLQERVEAVEALGRLPDNQAFDREALGQLIEPRQPPELRRAALRATNRSPALLEAALEGWALLTPEDQTVLDEAVLDRAWAAQLLLRRAEADPALRRGLTPARRATLAEHPDEAVAERARALFDVPRPPEVAAEFARLSTVDDSNADPARGREHFETLCSTCHYLDDLGQELGPDLAALTDRSTTGLLTALLDPSRDFLAPYQDYVLRTTDGRGLGGRVYDEASTYVRLRASDGRIQTAVRTEIEELSATGRSFMTEGLLAELSVQDVADLLAFLRAPRTPPKRFEGNQPAPVVADPHGEWHLTAGSAAIYGPELIYEVPTRNLGYWHTAQDHARWTVVVETEVEVDVWVEWACADSSAGETFLLDGAGALVSGEVEGTGPDWSHYVRAKVGRLTLAPGQHRFECRPAADPGRSLFDLRGFALVPVGQKPRGF